MPETNNINVDVLDDLIKLARKSKDDTYRVLALRGALRLLEQSADITPDNRLKYYTTTFAIAKNADEKKTVLGGVANAQDLRAISLVKPCLNDDALKPEALLARADLPDLPAETLVRLVRGMPSASAIPIVIYGLDESDCSFLPDDLTLQVGSAQPDDVLAMLRQLF